MRASPWLIVLAAACGGSSPAPQQPLANATSAHTTQPPIVHTGEPTEIAPYDRRSIQDGIDPHRVEIFACYEVALQTQPGLAGKVVVTFEIGIDGTVVQASATGLDPGVAACVADAIKAVTFPAPQGGVVTVTYPFEFSP